MTKELYGRMVWGRDDAHILGGRRRPKNREKQRERERCALTIFSW